MPYKDPFDDIVEVSYAFEGIRGVLIHSKKNIRHKCFKFRRKPQEYNSYKFEKIRSTFQVWNQVQVALMLHSHEKFSTKNFVFDPGGNSDLSTLEDSHDSRTNHFEERGNDENPSVTRNLYPIRIQDVTNNPSPIRIKNVARNPSPTRTEDPLNYDGSPITRACAKKMNEASHVLIQAI